MRRAKSGGASILGPKNRSEREWNSPHSVALLGVTTQATWGHTMVCAMCCAAQDRRLAILEASPGAGVFSNARRGQASPGPGPPKVRKFWPFTLQCPEAYTRVRTTTLNTKHWALSQKWPMRPSGHQRSTDTRTGLDPSHRDRPLRLVPYHMVSHLITSQGYMGLS